MHSLEDLTRYVALVEKHRAAYALQPDVPPNIRKRYLAKLDSDIRRAKKDISNLVEHETAN